MELILSILSLVMMALAWSSGYHFGKATGIKATVGKFHDLHTRQRELVALTLAHFRRQKILRQIKRRAKSGHRPRRK
jgi:hypothetical protein